jgi:hypothetical protein
MYEMIDLVHLDHLTYMDEYKDSTYLINKQKKQEKNAMFVSYEVMMEKI